MKESPVFEILENEDSLLMYRIENYIFQSY